MKERRKEEGRRNKGGKEDRRREERKRGREEERRSSSSPQCTRREGARGSHCFYPSGNAKDSCKAIVPSGLRKRVEMSRISSD
jgi:hypothetical protein